MTRGISAADILVSRAMPFLPNLTATNDLTVQTKRPLTR
jgi:hypothetical protein